jgi:hypothetical protein
VQLCQAKQVVGRAQSSNARGSNDFPMSAARARALGRSGGIDVQNDASGLAPIDPIALGIEKPKIGHEMFLIVRRQGVNVRCFGTSGWTCDEWRGPLARPAATGRRTRPAAVRSPRSARRCRLRPRLRARLRGHRVEAIGRHSCDLMRVSGKRARDWHDTCDRALGHLIACKVATSVPKPIRT